MSEIITTGVNRHEPTVFEVFFDDKARSEDKWGWLLKVQKDAEEKDIRFGAQPTEQGYMMAFESEGDAQAVMAAVQAKSQAFAENYRRRIIERVSAEFADDDAKEYAIKTGLPPPAPGQD
jgi:hypothetical protein